MRDWGLPGDRDGEVAWKDIGLEGDSAQHPACGRGETVGVGMGPKGSSPPRRVRVVRLSSPREERGPRVGDKLSQSLGHQSGQGEFNPWIPGMKGDSNLFKKISGEDELHLLTCRTGW